jgi:hypothetical protein
MLLPKSCEKIVIEDLPQALQCLGPFTCMCFRDTYLNSERQQVLSALIVMECYTPSPEDSGP